MKNTGISFALVRRHAGAALLLAAFVGACSSSSENGDNKGPLNGTGATGPVFNPTGGPDGSNGAAAGPNFRKCVGQSAGSEQVVATGPLDIYLIFDRTASMGQDCDFTPGTQPPVNSKACFATYAISEYFMGVNAANDTRLAFQFMSLNANDCNGDAYATPLIDMTQLPVPANHQLIAAISNENFAGGIGTHIEGAIRGLSAYTTQHNQAVGPARTTIGVLMTDGDPNGCDENIGNLAQLVTDHATATGGAVKLFFIGETGATLANLEQYAVPGGAAAHTDFCGNGPSPCHYWDVGNGNSAAFESAMASIVGQATTSHPIPCTFSIPPAPTGEVLDPAKVNVRFTDQNQQATGIFKVASKDTCDPTSGGWYYNDASHPTEVILCDASCSTVSAASGANLDVEFGCASETGPIH